MQGLSFIFAALNVVLGYVYVRNIIDYLNGQYIHDAIRFTIYIFFWDIFLLLLLIISLSGSNKKLAPGMFIIGIAHNISANAGVVSPPFTGVLISIIAVLLVVLQIGPFKESKKNGTV